MAIKSEPGTTRRLSSQIAATAAGIGKSSSHCPEVAQAKSAEVQKEFKIMSFIVIKSRAERKPNRTDPFSQEQY
jgi:hypothetical protein